MQAPKLIAEIGCNHKGDLATAKKMVHIAAVFCEVDVVKFQKRRPKELLSEDEYRAPHPNPMHAYGDTYGEHREFLELGIDEHRELQSLCSELGVEYSTSVWDITSAKEVASLAPPLVKIGSASNQHYEMMDALCAEYDGEVHVSLGMTTHEEQARIVSFFEERDRARDLVLYACTSGYPVGFEDLALGEITRLRESFGRRVKAIGFSGHHLGIAADVAAMTLGAQWIERHFTLDRTWKGTDHAASLEPDGLRKLARDLHNVAVSLAPKESEILPVEQVQRDKLKWRG